MNQHVPLVTVIVPTFNSAKTLRFALESILRQELQDFEVRVVGDGCADASEEVVASFKDSRLHWENLPKNSGSQSMPNNTALQKALGTYVAYLGHDDLWFPWHLSELIASIEKERADFVFSLCAMLGPEGVKDALGPLPMHERSFASHFAPPSCWLHKKDLMEPHHFWRCDVEKLCFPIDRDLWRRIFRSGKKMHFHPSLSVIKFPSPWWKSYSLTQNHPQEPFLSSLYHTPKDLQIHLLTQMVLKLSAKEKRKPWWKRWAESYGLDRFPLSYLKRRHFQKQRKRSLILRGLNETVRHVG